MAKKKTKKNKGKSSIKLDTKLKGTETILDDGDDLDRLYNIFDVTDENDIEGILDGSIGFENEW